MVNGSLPTCSKNTITDNTGNPALVHFQTNPASPTTPALKQF